MNYEEMQRAEAEFLRAIDPPKQKKQRGASKAQLEHRAKALGFCGECGEPWGTHSMEAARECRSRLVKAVRR